MELILALILFAVMIGVWALMPSDATLSAPEASPSAIEPMLGQLAQ
jgi:hypothetical protein